MKHVKNNNYEKKNFFYSNLFLVLSLSFSVLVINGTITYLKKLYPFIFTGLMKIMILIVVLL